jgi:NitT/TauT family transport system permease protein
MMRFAAFIRSLKNSEEPRSFRLLGFGLVPMRRLTSPILLLVLWHVAVTRFGFGDRFVPAPLDVFDALHRWMVGGGSLMDRYSGTWGEAVAASSMRVLGGFLIAAIVAIPVGILVGRYRIMDDMIDPVLQLLRPVPTSSFIPFALVFFGIGPLAAMALIALGAFFPIVLNTIAGARHVSELHLRSALMLGASPTYVLRHVVVPASLPSIMVGLRLAMGLSWVLVVVAEMVAVKSGLGYELWNAYYYARMDIVVAAMLTIGVLGFLSDWVVLLLAKRLTDWQQATQQ